MLFKARDIWCEFSQKYPMSFPSTNTKILINVPILVKSLKSIIIPYIYEDLC